MRPEDTPHESLMSPNDMLISIIRFRKQEYEHTLQRTPVSIDYPPPTLQLDITTHSIHTLFQNNSKLWVTVDGIRYITEAAPIALLVRTDGRSIDTSHESQSLLVSAITVRRNNLERRYGIYPMSASRKQRHPYWDEPFTSAFISSLQYDMTNFPDKIAYKIRRTISEEELLYLADDTQKELILTALLSDADPYPKFRRSTGIDPRSILASILK
jgi:hypothetical protein